MKAETGIDGTTATTIGRQMTQEDIQKAWNMMSMHNSELLLENERLKKQLMQQSLWYAIKRAYLIWRGKE